MPYDLIIKNGTVADGTGMPRRRADVAVVEGRIAAVGRVDGRAARVIDAEGAIVAPGFIDIHTHYDAQVLWDGLLTCSPWHGVTTVLTGNCGYTLAPCRPADRDFLAGMFARVEGVDIEVLKSSLDWEWATFPEYLARVERQRLGINVGVLVGHSAVRRYVLGEASATRASTDAEVREQRRLVREALAAGAWGFSTSLSPTHRCPDGSPVPSRQATHAEVIELGAALAEFGVGSVEVLPESYRAPEGFSEADERLMVRLSMESGRPVNWNELSHVWETPGAWRRQLATMERASAAGAAVYAVARCQRLDVPWSFLHPGPAFSAFPRWREVLRQPAEQRKRSLADPAVRAALRADADRTDPTMLEYRRLPNMIVVRAKRPEHRKLEGRRLGDLASATGRHVVDEMLAIAQDEGYETEFAIVGVRNGDPEAVATMLRSPYAIAGISDAGAHMDRMSGSVYSTFLLAHWVRERGLLTLEEAVRRLTFMPAMVYGLRDRGLIQVGMAADIVVFDAERVRPLDTEPFQDLPGGRTRLGNRADGVRHVMVNGQGILEDGRDTGARPGRLLRSSARHAGAT